MLDELIVMAVLLLSAAVPATATAQQLSIGIGFPNVSIGINLPLYPQLEPVPGYPVYYAPGVNSNYFFYDGMYWVYQDDNWYASTWYNGPWGVVDPFYVPVYVLRIPVRYYRQPPMYFRGWRADAPPRWGDHWGNDWEQRHSGWDRWDRRSVPERPPLPTYQRQYTGDRYPRRVEQQQELQQRNYRYEPRDPVVRQQYQAQQARTAPTPVQRGAQEQPQERNAGPRDNQRSERPPQIEQSPPTPRTQMPPQRDRDRDADVPRAAPAQERPQPRTPPGQSQRFERQPQIEQSTPAPRTQAPPQRGRDADVQRAAPDQDRPQPRVAPGHSQRQQPEQRGGQREQQPPGPAEGRAQHDQRQKGQGQGRKNDREDDERGRDRER